jgi:hypothetical protein
MTAAEEYDKIFQRFVGSGVNDQSIPLGFIDTIDWPHEKPHAA